MAYHWMDAVSRDGRVDPCMVWMTDEMKKDVAVRQYEWKNSPLSVHRLHVKWDS